MYFKSKKELNNDRFVDLNLLGAVRLVHSDLRVDRILFFLLDRDIELRGKSTSIFHCRNRWGLNQFRKACEIGAFQNCKKMVQWIHRIRPGGRDYIKLAEHINSMSWGRALYFKSLHHLPGFVYSPRMAESDRDCKGRDLIERMVV